MTIRSGTYVPKHEKTVVFWPLPDANGDGEEVWMEKKDGAGNVVGRDRAVDNNGRPVKRYTAPANFRNIPSYDHTENHVLHDGNGRIYRTPTGEAVPIREGEAVVLHANGSVAYLVDDYARYLFAQSHDHVSDDRADTADHPEGTEGTTPAAVDESTVPDADMEDFRAWQQARHGNGGADA